MWHKIKSDDDEVKKVKLFPIQDEVQAATKPPHSFLSRLQEVSRSKPNPPHLHCDQRVAGRIRNSQIFCPHWNRYIMNRIYSSLPSNGADTIDSLDFFRLKLRLIKKPRSSCHPRCSRCRHWPTRCRCRPPTCRSRYSHHHFPNVLLIRSYHPNTLLTRCFPNNVDPNHPNNIFFGGGQKLFKLQFIQFILIILFL